MLKYFRKKLDAIKKKLSITDKKPEDAFENLPRWEMISTIVDPSPVYDMFPDETDEALPVAAAIATLIQNIAIEELFSDNDAELTKIIENRLKIIRHINDHTILFPEYVEIAKEMTVVHENYKDMQLTVAQFFEEKSYLMDTDERAGVSRALRIRF